jgi:RNA polymerase sigma factor (sigma-70 family)
MDNPSTRHHARHERPKRSKRSSDAGVPECLREQRFAPLLDGAAEIELARALDVSRRALAGIALRLPAAVRHGILGDDLQPPQRDGRWALEHLEGFYNRFTRVAMAGGENDLLPVLRRVQRHKRKLDGAREQLILSNLRLVVYVARRYRNRGVSRDDLFQEGCIGLMKAVEKFDYTLGNRFSTYAYWWIQQTIDRALTVKWRTIRLPVHLVTAWRKISRVTEALEQRLGREPSLAEIADATEMTASEVEDVRNAVRDSREEARPEDSTYDPAEALEGGGPETIEGEVESRERRDHVRRTLDTLDEREQKVIRMRFGIGRRRASTLQEVGGELNLSRERVRQIESAAIEKLRASVVLRAC